MGFNSDLMGFHCDLMRFKRDLMGFNSDSTEVEWDIHSGKLSLNNGNSPFTIGKFTISMTIFNGWLDGIGFMNYG